MSQARLLFIKIPDSYSMKSGSFELDPSIPLPILVDEAEVAAGFNMASLNKERLLAGMLSVLSAGAASGQEHEQAAYYRSFIKAASPDMATQLAAVGIGKARNSEFPEAEDVFLAWQGLKPESVEPVANRALALAERARACRRSGREEEAETHEAAAKRLFDQAARMEPPSAVAFFHAARFNYEQRDFERAKSLFDSALALGLDDEMAEEAAKLSHGIEARGLQDTLFKEAFDFVRMGREADGLERIEAFLERNPGLWNGWFIKGWALRRLERWEEGLAAFGTALDLASKDSLAGEELADILNESAICLMELGRHSQAQTALKRALALEPENVKIISNLGILALKAGDKREARGFFLSALEIDPDDPTAARCLRSLDGE
jgi:tetratricopeptide (TPR) repeat protein